MGWWESAEGLIGDGPVDLIQDRMSVWTEEEVQPSWQQLLDAIGTALQQRGREWLADPEALLGRRVCARFTPPGIELRSNPNAPRDRHHDTLTEALEQVAEEYEETQQRKPTLSEALGTFAFSLRVAPERFLKNDEGWKLITIHTCEDRA